jgi:hypothetical protein
MRINLFSRVCFLLLLSITIPHTINSQVPERKLDKVIRKYQVLKMNAKDITNQVKRTGRFSITTQNEVFNLELEPHDLRSSNYMAEESGSGHVRYVSTVPAQTYRGKAAGMKGTEVRFTIGDKLEGIIISPKGKFFIERLSKYENTADSSSFIFYDQKDVNTEAFGTCEATLAEKISEASAIIAPATAAATSYREVELATEADYEYVQALGDSAAANNEILNIINQVDGIYKNELGLAFKVVYQHTWSTNDDPYSSTNPSTMLTEFRNHWNSSYTHIARDLAHMWTGKDMDGSTIGIANVGVTCRSASYSYGISQRFTSAVGKVALTAHEIGHNFNAQHTTTTECTNTIMAPSLGSGTQLTFCQTSRNQMSSHVNSYPGCLSTTTNPTPTPIPTPTPVPTPTPTPSPTPTPTTTYIVDNGSAGFSITGSWSTSTSYPGYYGRSYLHDGDSSANTTDTAKWTLPGPAGTYEVYMRWAAASNRPDAAPVDISHSSGIFRMGVNQRANGGVWVKLGMWSFAGGSNSYVLIRASDSGYTIADAVRFVRVQ